MYIKLEPHPAHIYYGALEQLGTLSSVRNLPVDQRPTPILDLVSFSELQDWTLAADDLVRNGNPYRLFDLTNHKLNPILAETRGGDQAAQNLRGIARQIQELIPLINTNRGDEIWNFNYARLQKDLNNFSADRSHIKPMNPIVDLLKTRLSGFSNTGHLQWLEATRWCIDHQWVQQGITQLQEGILSWCCTYFEAQKLTSAGFFNPHDKDIRSILSFALQECNNPKGPRPEEEWKDSVVVHKSLVKSLMAHPLVEALNNVYRNLSSLRNDINHGGYTRPSQASKAFSTKLRMYYEEVYSIVTRFSPS